MVNHPIRKGEIQTMEKKDSSLTYSAYQGADDLVAMQQALASWIHESGGCGYDHVGDLPHRIYNGLRSRYPLDEAIRLWHIDGHLEGFALVNPNRGLYDVRISPAHRANILEREALSWATTTLRTWMDNEGATDKDVQTDAYTCDKQRIECLAELGYRPEEKPWMITNERRLNDNSPGIILPDGYSIRSGMKETDSAALAEVHNGAFGSIWSAEVYLNEVMRKPGYDPALEHVVVAPDGTFAAFCITWLDTINKIGLFEPVGTHKEYQRMGLGRALMAFGLDFMRGRGMHLAQVGNATDNPASNSLYHAMGFKPKYQCTLYRRH
jgi:mycothiol synthase